MTWAMARTILRTFVMMCFMSPCSDDGTKHMVMEARAETASWSKR